MIERRAIEMTLVVIQRFVVKATIQLCRRGLHGFPIEEWLLDGRALSEFDLNEWVFPFASFFQIWAGFVCVPPPIIVHAVTSTMRK